MKKKFKYLSFRILLLFGITFFLILGILITFAIYTKLDNKSFIPLIIFSLIWILSLFLLYKLCYLPYIAMERLMNLFVSGYTLQALYETEYMYSPGMEAAIMKTKDFLDTDKLLSVSKRQAQYLALQNQINPHFLYNTLEGIRGEALIGGVLNVAEMTEALATFFRYTISNVENLVTVEDELNNTNMYFRIQQYRFGERLQMKIECNENDKTEILKCKLPKLTLQPIVENSIIHGIERKVGNGLLKIKFEITEKRLLIFISDDGIGMSYEILKQMQDSINKPSIKLISKEKEQKGGIAMVNVNNRIKLLFGEEYGITIYSTPDVGTDVSIALPIILDDKKFEKKVKTI